MTSPVIGFAGMTHLGINSAAAAAARGFRTVCYDADAAVIAALDQGKPPVLEPGLDEVLKKHAKRLSYASSLEALSECDVVYIATDVPTDDAGASDLAPIRRLIRSVKPMLGKKAVLVVLCQVPPGFTRGFTRELGLPPQNICYQVETLVFGRAYERALKPERFILGCADPSTKIPKHLETYLRAFRCPILPMRYESAELAKIAINCCLVSSISVANTLAELCENIGADWSEIVPALKLDARIGQGAYLAPGLGIAGGNLERDLATVVRLAGERGTDAGVVKAWVANSRHRRDWAARTIRKLVLEKDPAAVIAVWGLAYKENTHSVKNSPSLATIAQLGDTKLQLHDPVVKKAKVFEKALEAARGADALMILTPWPEYRAIAPGEIRRAMRGKIVLDPYAILDRTRAARAGLEVYTLGRHA